MAVEVQRVVLIQDASRDVSPDAIGNSLKGFSLKPGDVFFLLGILHQVNNPSMLSFRGSSISLRYKVKIDSSSMFGASHKIIKEEFAKKQEEYKNNEDIIRFSKQCEEDNIEFHVEVKVGSSSKMVALKAAKTFKATWIILDRQMKNEKNFFKERLSCGISRTKRDNSIEILWEPRPKRNVKSSPERSTRDCVTYDEMIPEYESPRLTNFRKARATDDESSWKNNRKQLTSFSISSSSEQLTSSTSTSNTNETKHYSTSDTTTTTTTTAGESPFSVTETNRYKDASGSPEESETKNQKDWMAKTPSEQFKISISSIHQHEVEPNSQATNESSHSVKEKKAEAKLGKKLKSRMVTYDEMIPEYESPRLTNFRNVRATDDESQRKNNRKQLTAFSKSSSSEQLTASASTSTSNPNETKHYSTSDIATTATDIATAGESPLSGHNKDTGAGTSPDESQTKNQNQMDWMARSPSEQFKISNCSICQNKRPKIGYKRDFTYAEIYAATEAFNPKNFLSKGGFGSVYRGELLNGLKIAVKQHKNDATSLQGEKEFRSEIHVLSTVSHENLVMLLGSCSEKTHWLLVYEYVCAGSLDQQLSKHARRALSWKKRVKIALGAAKGLLYLHENNIIHRDMRPSNILVTHDHEILLGDFGLARTQQGGSDHSSETRVVGTLGYLAPEYAESGKVSKKTDVYAFGVVLLQLITGLKTTDKILGGKSLVGWARPLLKERDYPSLIDQRLIDSYDVHQLFWMVRVAEKCLSKVPQKRLTMETVVYALNYIMDKENNLKFKDFSPANSDSLPSIRSSPEDIESQADDDTDFITIEPTPINSQSQMSMQRLPPSPPIQTFEFFKNVNDLKPVYEL